MQKKNKIQSRKDELLKFESSPNILYRSISILLRVGHALSDYSRYALLGTVFLFKFLEWWYSSESKLAAPHAQKPIPPPPDPPKKAPGGLDLPRSFEICPLCFKKRTNPTLVSNSGYCYCYACIHKFVAENQCDPVSRIPSSLEQLRRIYDKENS